MKIEGRPYFNASQIESKSKLLLTNFSPDYFKTIKPTPLKSIAKFLQDSYKIIFNFDVALGFNNQNSKILGAFNPIKRVILIDSSLQQDEDKFNFTLAHELGHLSLHRKIKITRESKDENDISDTVSETMFIKKDLKSEVEWLEWQANFYASALLMPSEIFQAALINIQRELGISRVGKIFVDNQPCNQKTLYEAIGKLSNFFRVSKSAVEYRLSYLKLIDDQRKNFIRDYLKDFNI